MDFDKLIDDILADALAKAKDLGAEGSALVESAKTSAQIVAQAGKRLLAGQIDQTGATTVAMDGIRQTQQLATAAGNLAAAGFVGYLKGVWGVIAKILPVKL